MGKKEKYSVIKITNSIPIQEYCQEQKIGCRCVEIPFTLLKMLWSQSWDKRVCIKMKDDI